MSRTISRARIIESFLPVHAGPGAAKATVMPQVRGPGAGPRTRGSPLLVARALRLVRRDGDVRLQLQERLLADPLDVHQLLDLLEAAALLAVLGDPLRRGGADAGQRLELR